ncbi:MAG: iron-containing alcohol dehydrogenase family protein [Clostridia bacterium]|nr:iron-containing alcohol dehydrogenase family protein [Clostridia bacterium]
MSVNRMVYAGTAYFGEYAREEILTEAEKRHFKSAFIVTDKDIAECGITGKVEEVLLKGNIKYDIYKDVKPNPTIENVLSCFEAYSINKSDFIIAVGGGSVIDTAKAVSVIVNNSENIDVASLEGIDRSKNFALPLVAVPTTAGTGSETTMDYVITNKAEKRKMACMDSKAVPVAAILDTEIMASLPLKLTAATAMDALTHCVESYLSKGAFSFSEALSLKGVSLIAENFMNVLKYPSDLNVRKELAIAQYMAGMSFTNVGLGIVHSMAHPLSAFYDIPHGVANALILPYVIKFNADVCKEKMIYLAKAFDSKFEGDDHIRAAEHCAEIVNKFNKEAGLPQRLAAVNVNKNDIDELALSAFNDAATGDNMKEVGVEDLKNLYLEMF